MRKIEREEQSRTINRGVSSPAKVVVLRINKVLHDEIVLAAKECMIPPEQFMEECIEVVAAARRCQSLSMAETLAATMERAGKRQPWHKAHIPNCRYVSRNYRGKKCNCPLTVETVM